MFQNVINIPELNANRLKMNQSMHTWPAVTVCGDGGGDKKNRDPYYSKKNYNVHEWATGGRWG